MIIKNRNFEFIREEGASCFNEIKVTLYKFHLNDTKVYYFHIINLSVQKHFKGAIRMKLIKKK